MPTYAISIKAGPWTEQGHRTFEYVGPGSNKPVRMTQALNQLGPKTVQYRGIDAFWRAQLDTGQVPRPVILGLLGKVDRADQNERLKVGRFLIQAEWYDEALAELDGIARDFPDLAETVGAADAGKAFAGNGRPLPEQLGISVAEACEDGIGQLAEMLVEAIHCTGSRIGFAVASL